MLFGIMRDPPGQGGFLYHNATENMVAVKH
jgi:hypothetical protein